jgi:hypothetical protein
VRQPVRRTRRWARPSSRDGVDHVRGDVSGRSARGRGRVSGGDGFGGDLLRRTSPGGAPARPLRSELHRFRGRGAATAFARGPPTGVGPELRHSGGFRRLGG